ncbi:zinc finger CCHC domain-containing protein 4 [Culex quinquefasciatus]|uniref:Zinc finger CCHC domain-containing protein 4 n=1 Tax=Culex quinquefasciatus TaxID=7176 RepID=B0X1A4_CULQU|nr:zinc finger CCHC domain-containing protein 4 [Culex quinquefasciatus]|eukprot:XP_001863426.1 zinc finger CCHC domain-containing protein 4 [Culex quinquefasciatus]
MFERYLKHVEPSSRICIFTDPPFGCRTELLANTIQTINQMYNHINSFVQQVLPTFWIFPYFMETYIRQEMPSMEMADYQVNYTNHEKYREGSKAIKNGSPVRMFTNVPLGMIRLPTGEGYKYCQKCDKSVLKSNSHCSICKACTSKNGAPYKHCSKCHICVKTNYVHCGKCGRCAQVEEHNCQQYKRMVSCRICLGRGHVEKGCSFWKRYGISRMFQVGCAVCGGKAHILRDCAKRKVLTKEVYFLGKYHNEINEPI